MCTTCVVSVSVLDKYNKCIDESTHTVNSVVKQESRATVNKGQLVISW